MSSKITGPKNLSVHSDKMTAFYLHKTSNTHIKKWQIFLPFTVLSVTHVTIIHHSIMDHFYQSPVSFLYT